MPATTTNIDHELNKAELAHQSFVIMKLSDKASP